MAGELRNEGFKELESLGGWRWFAGYVKNEKEGEQ